MKKALNIFYKFNGNLLHSFINFNKKRISSLFNPRTIGRAQNKWEMLKETTFIQGEIDMYLRILPLQDTASDRSVSHLQ